MTKQQNIGSSIRFFGHKKKFVSETPSWCLYYNYNFKKHFKNDPAILSPGDKYYDFDDPTNLKTKK